MQFTSIFVLLFVIGTLGSFFLNQWLEWYDYQYRARNGRKIPAELAGYVDDAVLDKTCRYEDTKYRLWVPKDILTLVLTLALVFSGFYPWILERVQSVVSSVYLTSLLFFVLGSIPGVILSLPFDLYDEFSVEKKFGFSTLTVRLWIVDQIKGLLVSAVLGIPLLFVMVALLEHAAAWWWILLGAVYVAFSLVVSLVYPRFIAPLFNKFSPLPDGNLKTRLSSLLEKVGFKSSGVSVMDASKRSKHSNAYFTGFGKTKRIVLYDTLVTQLSPEEIEAVLGHELGHYKKHHILIRMAVSIPVMFAMLFFVSLFITHPALYQSFGFSAGSEQLAHIGYVGIFLVSLVFGGYAELYKLLSNGLSRRDEFEADRYAAEICGSGEPLCSALIKLNRENLSELTPPRVYCLFNYNHPPLLERIRHIREN